MNAGYVSWRDTQSGSWYVETLDRILDENASTDDLVTMLMMVSFSLYTSKVSCGSLECPLSFRAFEFKRTHMVIACACFQVNHEVSQNSAKGL